MSIEFQQKKGLNFRKFILTSDKIIVERRTFRKNEKYEVKLDKLGLDIHYQADNNIAGKIFLGVCLVLTIGSVFGIFLSTGKDITTWIVNAVLWTVMSFIAYIKPHDDDLFLVGGQINLVFYRDVPNEKDVVAFIEKIKQHVKIYMLEKYTVFDSMTKDFDYYNRLHWLRDLEIISQSEYTEYKKAFDLQKLL